MLGWTLSANNEVFLVFPKFASMRVYGYLLSALTLPGQGGCETKEPEFACAKRAVSCEYAPLWSSSPWSDLRFSMPSQQIPQESFFNPWPGVSE